MSLQSSAEPIYLYQVPSLIQNEAWYPFHLCVIFHTAVVLAGNPVSQGAQGVQGGVCGQQPGRHHRFLPDERTTTLIMGPCKLSWKGVKVMKAQVVMEDHERDESTSCHGRV